MRRMISVVTVSFPKTLDPRGIWLYQHAMITPLIFQNLVKTDRNGHPAADLASRWEISEGGRRYSFHLDPNAVFHDGTKVTAQDAAFSLSRYFWNDDNRPVDYIRDIFVDCENLPKGKICGSFVAKDENTLEVHLRTPYHPLLSLLSMGEFGIYQQAAFEKDVFVGSGPMIPHFDALRNSWALSHFERYRGMPASLPELRFVEAKNSEELSSLMRSGQPDLVLGWGADPYADVPDPSYLHVEPLNTLAVEQAFFSHKSELLQRLETRKALASLIREAAYADEVMPDHCERQSTFFPTGLLPGGYDSFDRDPMNNDEARREVETALSGKTISYLATGSNSKTKFVNKLRAILKECGVMLDSSPLPLNEFRERKLKGDFEFSFVGYVGMFPDPDGFLEILQFMGSFPKEEFLGKVSRIRGMEDASARLEAYSRAAIDFEKEWMIVPVYAPTIVIAKRNGMVAPHSHFPFTTDLWKVFLNDD